MTVPTNANTALRSRLQAGEAAVGIWSILPSPGVVEIAAGAGFDFVILDGEHGGWRTGGDALENAVRACRVAGGDHSCAPLVRVPGANPFAVQSALDAGAEGIIIPQIADYAEARAALALTRYAPRGVRGFNPFTRAGRYGRGGGIDDAEIIAGLIIETPAAFRDLERIVALPELDVAYLGVYDMSVALGCAGDVRDPRVLSFVETAIPIITAAGKTAGLMVHDAAAVSTYAALGAGFFVYSVDTMIISRSFQELTNQFRLAPKGDMNGSEI